MCNVIDRLVSACKVAVVNLSYCIENHPQDANDKEVSENCVRELVKAVKEAEDDR